MQIKPTYIFEDKDSLGIDEVPVEGIIIIGDSDGTGHTRQVQKLAMGSYTPTSTIEDFLGSMNFKDVYKPEADVYPEVTDYTATAGQIEFPIEYDINKPVEIYKNGLKLRDDDYLLGNPEIISLAIGASLNDWIQLNTYNFDPEPGAFDLRTAVATNDSVSAKTEGLFFKFDGTTMYYPNGTSSSIAYRNLGTAWDLSTAGAAASGSIVESIDSLYISPGGTILIASNSDSGDVWLKYSFGIPWDITTLTKEQEVSADGALPQGVFCSPDGTKMFTTDQQQDAVKEWSLTTPWDLTTMSYVSSTPVTVDPKDLFFKYNGTKMYVAGSGRIYQYVLSTPWDITSASSDYSYYVSEHPSPYAFYISNDGLKAFITDANTNTNNKYILG